MGKHTVKSQFVIQGRFLQYQVTGTFKIKGIHLATAQGELYIKLPKELRYSSMQILQSGAWVQVQGYQKHNMMTGERKYKALSIVPATSCEELPLQLGVQSGPDLHAVPEPQALENHKLRKGKIRVCEKSSCRKRGSAAVLKALGETLEQANLGDQIQLSGMGCIDKCKAGPNVIIWPDKARYSRVTPTQAVEIVQQHFVQGSDQESLQTEPQPQTTADLSSSSV